MAGRGPQSFKKRQKEQQRKEKQQEKLARKVERKKMGPLPEGEDEDPFSLDHLDRPIPGLIDEAAESERT
jgi:hypothetical protein